LLTTADLVLCLIILLRVLASFQGSGLFAVATGTTACSANTSLAAVDLMAGILAVSAGRLSIPSATTCSGEEEGPHSGCCCSC
jgi:hypothetical protein